MPAPTIEQITLADEPSRWSAFGFTLAGECCLLGSVSVQLAGERPGSGISRWSLREIDTAELDGLPTAIGEQPAPAPAGEHPNGVIAIDHVVAITPQLDRTVAALQRAAAGLLPPRGGDPRGRAGARERRARVRRRRAPGALLGARAALRRPRAHRRRVRAPSRHDP